MSESQSPPPNDDAQTPPTSPLLIVVGAHLRAEEADRPLAYRVQQEVAQWITRQQEAGHQIQLKPIVCSDILYVNQTELHSRPTISIGGPGVNAVAAYLSDRLPATYVQDDEAIIQMDVDLVDLRVSIWGNNHALTVAVLDRFITTRLEGYLRAAATQIEP